MAESPLKIDIKDRVCLLTLNRPDSRNALSRELLAALTDAVIAADHDPEVSLVAITGAGDKAFCSGADLKEAHQRAQAAKPIGPLASPTP